MRRRIGSTSSRRPNAARRFYEQHDNYRHSFENDSDVHSSSFGEYDDDVKSRYNNNRNSTTAPSSAIDDGESSKRNGTKKQPLLSLSVVVVRKIITILQSFVTMVTNFMKRSKENVDLLDYCVSCSKRFSYLRKGKRRNQCANCMNDFCESCLRHKHDVFDGKHGSSTRQHAVCQYCFFTLCARHCRARCCNELSVKELKLFLARKGVNSQTALEKSDLIDLIHTWSLDLDAQARVADATSNNDADNSDDIDIEAGGNEEHHQGLNQRQHQQGQSSSSCASKRQQTSYSASSAHLMINSMMTGDGSMAHYHDYSNLGIHELRHVLSKRSINASGCIEKSDFVHLLIQSDNNSLVQ